MWVRSLPLLALVVTAATGCADAEHEPPRTFVSNAAAERCAGQLSPKANAIYRDIAPHMMPDTSLETIMRHRVMMMIVSGSMSMGAARPAAEKAAECLEMLQH